MLKVLTCLIGDGLLPLFLIFFRTTSRSSSKVMKPESSRSACRKRLYQEVDAAFSDRHTSGELKPLVELPAEID